MIIPSIIIFAIALAVILLILKIIGKSIKIIWTVLINGLVGFVVLLIINFIPGLNVTINWWSALLTGLFGIPGLIVVLILQLVCHIV